MNLRQIVWTMVLLLAAATGWAAESGQLSRADSLRAKPFADAKVVSKLPAGQKVEILKREGAWYQVQVAGKAGWVNMLSVRKTAAAAAVSGGSIGKVATGRTGTGAVVSTSGIRGLNEEDLREATFTEEPVAFVEKFRTTEAQARQFAAAGGVKPRTVPPLTAPAKSTRPVSEEKQP